MCTTTSGTLTLAGLLKEPMTRAMMRSDGVSVRDFAALLVRVKGALADRDDPANPPPNMAWELEEA